MYDPDQVVEVKLGGLSEEELDALELDPTEYQHGTFELLVGGVPKGPLLNDVGIRLKGGVGSSRPVKTGKSGFKVRFDEFVKGQLFFGIKRLTLNNMIQDPSMVHETLTYELFRDLGLPASRTGYAFVDLNGADYGLFLNLETLDKISLPHWFETTQHLYEADAAGTDVTPGSAAKFEVDEGDDEDRNDLQTLIEHVGDPVGTWFDKVAPVADLAQMTGQWAVERYVSHWDGYAGAENPIFPESRPNNYYLHSDAEGVFQMMPWGTDQTWEYDMEFDEPAGGVMFNECLADEECKRLYLEGLTAVHCAVPGLDLGAHAGQLATMLAPFQAKEEVDRREATAEEIAEGVEDVETLAFLRREQLADYLTAEGVLGTGTDPCALPPEPETKPAPPASGGTPPSAPRVAIEGRFGRTRARGAFVFTPLWVTGPATGGQRIFTRVDGERRQLCADRTEGTAAGRLALRCRLPQWALDRLADDSLRLRVRVSFFPEFGTSEIGVRRLTLSRR